MARDEQPHKVSIEFLRVQSYLFAVPQLREMVGANVLLGETIRNRLVGLALERNGAIRPALPEGWRVPESLGSVDRDDPLLPGRADDLGDPIHQDDPRALYGRAILARDGGHFRVLFPNRRGAEQFKLDAERLILGELPGLMFQVSVEPLVEEQRKGGVDGTGPRLAPAGEVEERTLLPVDLPIFQVCQASGNGPASVWHRPKVVWQREGGDEYEADDPDEAAKFVSRAVAIRRERGNAFFKRNERTFDIIGLMQERLPCYKLRQPKDINDLCGGDYLAVITADGNGMGRRYTEWRNRCQENHPLTKEAWGERLYHSMRVAVRRALQEALKVFADHRGVRPYQLLMVGGDDLLMVCQARYAFDFLVAYAKALEGIPLADGNAAQQGSLSVGAGLVIAAPDFPFSSLHEAAERLAASAKIYQRALHQEVSVIDWQVTTYSTAVDPIALRQEEALVRDQFGKDEETLILSRKPYRILGEQGLEGLVASAQALARAPDSRSSRPARSQLRSMAEALSKGRFSAERVYRNLPDNVRKVLREGCGLTAESPWELVSRGGSEYYTRLRDLVEVYEVSHLGDVGKKAARRAREGRS